MFEAYATGQKSRFFDDKAAAIAWAKQFESGEVRNFETDTQVWLHYPQAQWA